jgi:formate dehydrogenase subunit gamma
VSGVARALRLALFHPSLFFLTGLFGVRANDARDPPVARRYLVLQFWRSVHSLLAGQLWKAEDGTWMARLRDVLGGHEERLPEVGKYNAGQKVVFLVECRSDHRADLQWHSDLDQYFAEFSTVETKRFAVLIHALAAVTIICALDRARVRGDLGARKRSAP